MEFSRMYIVTGVLEESLEDVLDAIAAAWRSIIGHYTRRTSTNAGIGRFKPDVDALPRLGSKQIINAVDEWRIETFCERGRAKAVVEAICSAHPYEEPVI